MSERGSFVTEYIYCSDCYDAVKKALYADDKETGDVPLKQLWAVTLPHWSTETLPIVAGRVGGGYPGEELLMMQDYIEQHVEPNICHEVRFAVLAQEGQEFIVAKPRQKQKAKP